MPNPNNPNTGILQDPNIDPNNNNGWSFNVFFNKYYENFNGTTPNSIIINHSTFNLLSNFFGTTEADFYIEYDFQYSGVQNDWLAINGPGVNTQNNRITPAFNNHSLVSLDFQNLSSLPTGAYSCEIYFKLLKKKINSSEFEIIDIISRTFSINVVSSIVNTNPYPEFQHYYLTYVRSTNQLYGNNIVNILNNPNGDILDCEFWHSAFQPKDNFTDTFNIEENVNSPFSSNPDLPQQGELLISGLIKKVVNGQILFNYAIYIHFKIIEENIIVTPNSLEFTLVKSLSQTKTATFTIDNPLNHVFYITSPPWLSLSDLSGDTTKTIVVTTENSSNLQLGELSDFISVNCNGKTFPVSVKITVIDTYVDNIKEDYNFCLNNKEITAFKINNASTFCRFSVKAAFKDFNGEYNVNFPFTLPFFKGKAILDIGKKIHSYFRKNLPIPFHPSSVSSQLLNKFIFEPCSFKVVIEELDKDYNILATTTTPNYKLYPGRRPKAFPLLSNHINRSRKKGAHYHFSYISGLVNASAVIDTSGNIQNFSLGTVELMSLADEMNKINFSAEKTINFGNKAINFYQLPSNYEIAVQWLNQNLTSEWAYFSGEYKFTDDFTQNFGQNAIKHLETKYSVKVVNKLNINTGYLLKSEKDLIAEIVESPMMYLYFGKTIYKAFCINSSLVKEDSTMELVQYELEFLIVE